MIGRDISASGQSGQAGQIKSWKRSEKKDQLAKTLLEPEKNPKDQRMVFDEKVKKVGRLFFNGLVKFLAAKCLIKIAQNPL